jgi:hypothetical protein
MKLRVLLLALAVAAQAVPCNGQPGNYPFVAANYPRGSRGEDLWLFPPDEPVATSNLPYELAGATFAADGRAIYGISPISPNGVNQGLPGVLKIEFEPLRVAPVPGTEAFMVQDFAVSAGQDKILIAVWTAKDRRCDLFEVKIPGGRAERILDFDCQPAGRNLSLSPDGEWAVATARDSHLDLIDLVHRTVRPLCSEESVGVWSPDGKWIAVFSKRHYVYLIDAHDIKRRRALGTAWGVVPAWSPDSRYLLLWKQHLFRCGFYLDIEPPASFEILDIESGRRSTVQSSFCKLTNGTSGWLRRDVVK